jgi:hypothetical protein
LATLADQHPDPVSHASDPENDIPPRKEVLAAQCAHEYFRVCGDVRQQWTEWQQQQLRIRFLGSALPHVWRTDGPAPSTAQSLSASFFRSEGSEESALRSTTGGYVHHCHELALASPRRWKSRLRAVHTPDRGTEQATMWPKRRPKFDTGTLRAENGVGCRWHSAVVDLTECRPSSGTEQGERQKSGTGRERDRNEEWVTSAGTHDVCLQSIGQTKNNYKLGIRIARLPFGKGF